MRLFVNQNKMVCCVHLDFDMWLLFCCLQLKGGPVPSWLVGSSWCQKSDAEPLCTSYDLAWITFDFISSFQCHMTQEIALTYGNNAHELGMNTYIHDDLHPLPGWFGVHLCLRSMGWKSSLVAKLCKKFGCSGPHEKYQSWIHVNLYVSISSTCYLFSCWFWLRFMVLVVKVG